MTPRDALAAAFGAPTARSILEVLHREGFAVVAIEAQIRSHRAGPPTERRPERRRVTPGGTLHRLLAAFAAMGDEGMTNDRCDEVLGSRRPSGSNRRADLEKAGLVEWCGEAQPLNGRARGVYRITTGGLETLRRLDAEIGGGR